jgi:uncharacterized protein (DUF2461 family)
MAVKREKNNQQLGISRAPYKTNFDAHLVAYAKKPHDRAGYYVHLEPGNVFVAGGAYMPPAPWLKAIRQSIDREGKAFEKIQQASVHQTFCVHGRFLSS